MEKKYEGITLNEEGRWVASVNGRNLIPAKTIDVAINMRNNYIVINKLQGKIPLIQL